MLNINIESIPKFFAPKGMYISNSERAAASEWLTVTDVTAELGMTQAEARIGLSMFLGKAGISKNDHTASIHWSVEYAKKNAPHLIREAADRKFPLYMLIIVRFTYHDYASSAADTIDCTKCAGKGFAKRVRMVEKSHYTMRLPQWAKDFRQSPSDFEVKRQVQEVDPVLCMKCHGTGKIGRRCQCSGTGETLDHKESELQGVPIYKTCKRCEGRGFSRLRSSDAYRGILPELPGLPEHTWRYNWKPFYESLVTKCFMEESFTDAQLRWVTKTANLIDFTWNSDTILTELPFLCKFSLNDGRYMFNVIKPASERVFRFEVRDDPERVRQFVNRVFARLPEPWRLGGR